MCRIVHHHTYALQMYLINKQNSYNYNKLDNITDSGNTQLFNYNLLIMNFSLLNQPRYIITMHWNNQNTDYVVFGFPYHIYSMN